MENRKCVGCEKEFIFRACPSDVSSGRGKFCSKQCKDKNLLKHPRILTCYYCKKEFKLKNGRPYKFCSQKCKNISQIGTKQKEESIGKISGSNNKRWSGGITYRDGYKFVLVKKDGNRYVPEHRQIMAKSMGRELFKTEVVHHIDGNKLNNSITNLFLFEETAEHTRLHAALRRNAKKNETERNDTRMDRQRWIYYSSENGG